jgi:hypothetical protein
MSALAATMSPCVACSVHRPRKRPPTVLHASGPTRSITLQPLAPGITLSRGSYSLDSPTLRVASGSGIA